MSNSYKMKIQISNSHVDTDATMKELAIVNSLQDIEGLHIQHLNSFTNYLEDNNLGVFLLYRQIDIINKPKFGTELLLETHPYNSTPISGYRHIFMYDESNNLLVSTNSFGAFIDLSSYNPVRIPKEIVESINDGEKSDLMEVLPRKVKFDLDSPNTLLDTIKIKHSHIDRYHHVNNAFYIQFTLDAFNKPFEYNRIRAEYNKSLQLENTAKIYLNIDEKDTKTIIIKNELEEICAIIEFTTINT